MFGKILCFFGLHDWGKWQLYYVKLDWQRRSCRRKCGATGVRDHPNSINRGYL